MKVSKPISASHFAIQFMLTAVVLFLSLNTKAETADDDVSAMIQGRNIAEQLLEQQPAQDFTQTGKLIIRSPQKKRAIDFKCTIQVLHEGWRSTYEAFHSNVTETLVIFHRAPQSSQIESDFPTRTEKPSLTRPTDSGYPSPLSGKNIIVTGKNENQLVFPNQYSHIHVLDLTDSKSKLRDHLYSFANSDFWDCDLGLEFLHWPEQKVLPKTTSLKRGRAYTLLESTNPDPSTNGYSRVLSWIDKETGGILEAEAYDFNGKLLKDFAPKSFKKVNGQWELQEMEIRNVQTGSSTKLEFDLKKN